MRRRGKVLAKEQQFPNFTAGKSKSGLFLPSKQGAVSMSDPLRVAVIGASGIGQHHARWYHPSTKMSVSPAKTGSANAIKISTVPDSRYNRTTEFPSTSLATLRPSKGIS